MTATIDGPLFDSEPGHPVVRAVARVPAPLLATPIETASTGTASTGTVPTETAPTEPTSSDPEPEPAVDPGPPPPMVMAPRGAVQSATQVRSHARTKGRTWLTRHGRGAIIAVVVTVAVVAVAQQLVRGWLADGAFVDLGQVTLTADAVPLGQPEAVSVLAVTVNERDRVLTGEEVATVRTAAGGIVALRAPFDATVAAVNVRAGAVALAGEPVVTLYDPNRLTFRTTVPADELRRLRLGMTVTVDGPGLPRPVTATLDRVVPLVGASDGAAGGLTVVLVPVPADAAVVAGLMPGLAYHAVADTGTAPDAPPALGA